MEPLTCLVIPGLVAAAIVGIACRRVRAEAAASARQRAYDAYQAALAQLKRDPTNADHEHFALQVGRDYAKLIRARKGVTALDEAALSNDIRAAMAGGMAARAAVTRQRAYDAYQTALRLKKEPTSADCKQHTICVATITHDQRSITVVDDAALSNVVVPRQQLQPRPRPRRRGP